MAYTQADLTNVEQAIVALSTNKRVVKFVIDGEVTEYSSVAMPQLQGLRNEIASELSASNPDPNIITSFVVHRGKGL